MPSDFTFASVALMSGENRSEPRAQRRQVIEYSAISSTETPLPAGLRPVSLLLTRTGAVSVGDRLVGAPSEPERLVAASLAHVRAVAEALPVDAEDEKVVDDLMARRAGTLAARRLVKRDMKAT